MDTQGGTNPDRIGTVFPVTLTALGVVYGDIGTSPLYAIRECFFGSHSVGPTHENVHGVQSLVLYALLLVISVKYTCIVMRADNQGEGGILSLTALLPTRNSARNGRYYALLVALVIGALLFALVTTWKTGRTLVAERLTARAFPLEDARERSFQLNRRRAVRAARCANRDRRYAERAFLGRRRRGKRRAFERGLEPTHLLDEEEDGQRHNQKADDVVDELAVGDDRNASGFGIRQGHRNTFRSVEHQEQTGEVRSPEQQADRRHDHAFDERGDDTSEGSSQDDANSQIQHVAAGNEIPEFLEHAALLKMPG